MRREIPAKYLEASIEKNSSIERETAVSDSIHVKRVGSKHLYRESGLQILRQGFGESYLHRPTADYPSETRHEQRCKNRHAPVVIMLPKTATPMDFSRGRRCAPTDLF